MAWNGLNEPLSRRRTLRRLIQADIGMSWSEYVLQARLMRAMALLASTDRSVIDVASSVGYISPSGFTRAFRDRGRRRSAVAQAMRMRDGRYHRRCSDCQMLDGLNENMIDSKGALQIIGATGTAVTTTPTWKEIGVPLTG